MGPRKPTSWLEFLWGEVYERRIVLPTATIDCFNRFSHRA
jgi:hypothetical protein